MSTVDLQFENPSKRFKFRNLRGVYLREVFIKSILIVCAVFSILITTAIVGVVFFEAAEFFQREEATFLDFFTSLKWNPDLGSVNHYGVIALLSGTIMVSAIAMLIALPLGLITAIYLSEYASSRLRSFLKPILEILAGIPTVVYGYFALTVITPGLKLFSDGFSSFNSMSAGIAVGILCIPIVTSLSEDALRSVPRSLREGAFGLGATKFDVSIKVVVPAALSGIISAFLLAIARAIGETMIVAMAAGAQAQLTLSPMQETQTMTGWMVFILTGDASREETRFYSMFAVAAVLFVFTLCLTMFGQWVRRRFREEYQ